MSLMSDARDWHELRSQIVGWGAWFVKIKQLKTSIKSTQEATWLIGNPTFMEAMKKDP